MNAPIRKIGLLGGSFDPVHLGHLIIAQDALEGMNLDQVWFLPTARNPFKDSSPTATNAQRLSMLRAAIGQDPRWDICEREIHQPPPSYAIDTIEALNQLHPETTFYWIIGADQLPGLPNWHRFEELSRKTQFIVLPRHSSTTSPILPQTPPQQSRPWLLHCPQSHPFSVSSSEIRQRIKTRKPVDFFLHSAVIKLIYEQHIYSPYTKL